MADPRSNVNIILMMIMVILKWLVLKKMFEVVA